MTHLEPQSIVDTFNTRHKIGTPVTRYKLIRPLADPVDTVTSSMAWVTSTGQAVIRVDGHAAYVALESVVVK
jgi:hypothetical protein